jgi:hypothetical protein
VKTPNPGTSLDHDAPAMRCNGLPCAREKDWFLPGMVLPDKTQPSGFVARQRGTAVSVRGLSGTAPVLPWSRNIPNVPEGSVGGILRRLSALVGVENSLSPGNFQVIR